MIDDLSITVSGVRLAVRRILVTPDVGAPWLVFLHEGLGSIDQWRDFPLRLATATGHNALIYDRQGHGKSAGFSAPRPVDYHAQEAGMLAELLVALDVVRCVPFGHSDGGTMALLFASREPEATAALVVEAAHVAVEEIARRGIEEARAQYDAGALRDGLYAYHGEKVDAMFAAWADTWLSPAFAEWSIIEELGGITCPTLIIQGESDHYATPGHVDVLARGLGGPAETWVIPGVGHSPHREAKDEVLERVARFVAEAVVAP
jgi:pimeloyl-ACP methyl ester carboxylesterase